MFSLDKYPEVELLDHMVVLFLIWGGGDLIPFSVMTAPVYIPSNSAPGVYEGFLFLTLSSTHFLSFWWQLFWQVWGDISLWFWFAFPWWLVILSIFSCACWPSVCLLWRNIYSDLVPIFQLDCLFLFCYWVVRVF